MKQTVNCDFCGRDTTSKSRVCSHCCPKNLGHEDPGDRERRQGRMQTNTFISDAFISDRDDDVIADVHEAMADLIDG